MLYDMIIKGGTVIDPERGVCEKRDIYIKNKRIVAFVEDGVPTCEIEINAEGCYVAPGFIDDHIHCHMGNVLGGNPDPICLPSGVTTAVDPGSTGIINIKSFIDSTVSFSMTNVKALVHVNPYGVRMAPYEEITDPVIFDREGILETFRRYPDIVKGIKIRYSEGTVTGRGTAPLKAAVEIADYVEANGFPCPVVMHFSALPEDVEIEDLISVLRRGDIFAHLYQPTGKIIFDDERKLLPCMHKGREKGILFDSACSTTWSSVENLRDAFEQGFFPDIIGTDIVGYTMYKEPVVSLMNQMSFFINLGMKLEDVVKAVTYTPAKALNLLEEAGSLKVGMPADVAVFKLTDESKLFSDRYGGSFQGDKLLIPMATIRNGRTAFAQVFMKNKSYYGQKQ